MMRGFTKGVGADVLYLLINDFSGESALRSIWHYSQSGSYGSLIEDNDDTWFSDFNSDLLENNFNASIIGGSSNTLAFDWKKGHERLDYHFLWSQQY